MQTLVTDPATESSHLTRPRLRLGMALLAATATVLVIGLPADIISNPVFGREVPVRPWELPVLLATGALTGLWFGLQRRGEVPDGGRASTLGAAGLALFAVACPVCNKIVLLALGTSGALGIWAPLQPWLAGLSLAVLLGSVAYAARRRPCGDDSCRAI
ncbi:MAG: hypothetical protein L0H25_10245 [Micrococcales bacterium]|nr:hypothetical protein [Micrococcales bacterium]